MDGLSWLIVEMLAEQRLHPPRTNPLPSRQNGHSGVKRSLASTLVRLGLRLDPAAGEGLGAYEVSLARPESRRSL